MTIADRKLEATRRFDELKEQRENLLKQAEDCLTEMTKLQGAYRLLEELETEEVGKKKQVNKQANVIEVVPEEVSKQ